MPINNDGQVQELLIELLRTKDKALQYRQEADAVLQGVEALSGVGTTLEVFEGLLEVLKPFLRFENGIILQLTDDVSLREVISTLPEFASVAWVMGDIFHRVLQGETIVLFQPQLATEFQGLSNKQHSYCSSALITGLNSNDTHAILIFIHSENNVFDASSKSVLARFEPLMTQALVNIEYRDSLTALVDKRTEQLQTSEHRFKDFANSASDWFWELDPDNRYSYFAVDR